MATNGGCVRKMERKKSAQRKRSKTAKISFGGGRRKNFARGADRERVIEGSEEGGSLEGQGGLRGVLGVGFGVGGGHHHWVS